MDIRCFVGVLLGSDWMGIGIACALACGLASGLAFGLAFGVASALVAGFF